MSQISFGAIDAVVACFRFLAAMPDLGPDEAFVRAVAGRVELSAGAALACRKVLARHRDQLPRDIAALAMGEVEPPVAEPATIDALADVFELLGYPGVEAAVTTAPKRGRGRPRNGAAPLMQVERTRRWREGRDIVNIEIPAAVAKRLRRLREARSETTAELLTAAMDALQRCDAGSAD
jgi:hypothetical protein